MRFNPRIRPRLKPLNHIGETSKSSIGSWTSTGDDPQFLCEFPFLDLHTGWYMITLEIECENAFDSAKIYTDLGEGYIEDQAIKIPYQSRRISKRIVRFDRRALGIRFDPLSSKGEFTIRQLTMSPIAFRFAENRMLSKLMRRSPSDYGNSIVEARNRLKEKAAQTGEKYQSLLDTRYAALFSNPLRSHDYNQWIEKVENTQKPSVNNVISIERNVSERPKMSVVMPTFNSDLQLLDEAIQSVISQSYSNWQLCISDDGSNAPELIKYLKNICQNDQRIVAVYSDESRGIAANTNAALQLATGDYCVFLDHDDLLAEHALYEVANAIIENPSLKLIYSDEDKIDSAGARVEPHFKPDWNPDLLLAQNYICHLVALDRDLLARVGGCRTGYDGAQDHDLLLRVMGEIQAYEVRHLPKILYHWRMAEGSTSVTAGAKTYTTDSGVAAVQNYLDEAGVDATVEVGKYANTYRVNWPLPEKNPKVSIIIPTRDRIDILSICIASVLKKTDYKNYEIVVVNNESEEPATLEYFEKIKQQPNVRVIDYNDQFNYSAINNFAVSQAAGSVVTLMNNDIEVIDGGWLQEMVSHAIRREIGCVGAKLLYKNNMVQHAGVILGIGGVAGHAHKYFDAESAGYFSRLHLTQNMSAVTAACLTVEKRIYQEAGGLNETHLKVAFNDVDFCLRVGMQGLRNVWTPYALLYHHESISRGHDNTREKQTRFKKEALYMQQQWGKVLESDPAYNRNLTLTREDFSLAA